MNNAAGIALVFADMDGTFLASSKSIPIPNLRILNRLADLGVAFVPCTGRPVSAVPQELRAHRATRYVVGSNGAVIFDARAQRVLHVERMSKSKVLALYERVKHLHVTFDIFAGGKVYSEKERYEAMGGYGIDEPTLAMLRKVRKPVDLSVPQLVSRAQAVEKVTGFWRDTRDRDELARAIRDVGGFSSAHGHPKNFELQDQGVSKGSALVWLCEYAGVSASAAVAFGDEANDVPMIREAGCGVAMANAVPEVLEVAQAVTASNDAAGVALYLQALFA